MEGNRVASGIQRPFIDRQDVRFPGTALALTARVRAMHHWIRKGNADKAALMARDAAHVALWILRRSNEGRG